MKLEVIAIKILSRIMLDRIKSAIDSLLRDEQAVSAVGVPAQIILRIVIEQSLEWNSGLFLPILQHIRSTVQGRSLIQCLYSGFECQVIHDGSVTEPFQVRMGVRQAYFRLYFS